MSCVFCDGDGGAVLWRDALYRIVLADEPGYPGFLRVIANAHVKEMTDLDVAGRAALLGGVLAAERAVREVMAPDKINLAALGNLVPHLHWHVIPRFVDDPHYPRPVWCEPLRAAQRVAPEGLRAALAVALSRQLAPLAET